VIVFTLRLAARSTRWLGPAIIVMLAAATTDAGPGTAMTNASGTSILVVIVTCWLTVAIGNLDDDGHRELLSAAAGSRGRLHRDRAIAAYVAGNALALVLTIVGIAVAEHPATSVSTGVIVAICLLVQLASTAIGVGIGTLLHRPVVRNLGITMLVAVGALVGLVLLPPVQHVLRTLNGDRTGGVVVACVIAIAFGVAAVTAAGALADRAT
jgi:hypothetical protein